jgi:hypothetical protein
MEKAEIPMTANMALAIAVIPWLEDDLRTFSKR